MLERVDFLGAVEDTLVLGLVVVVLGFVVVVLDFVVVPPVVVPVVVLVCVLTVLVLLELLLLVVVVPVLVVVLLDVDSIFCGLVLALGFGVTVPVEAPSANAIGEKAEHANTSASANTKYRTVFFLCT